MQREQGPWDWLIPFIPPMLRVNRETREALRARLQEISMRNVLLQLAEGLKQHWPLLLRFGLPAGLWIAGLLWVDRQAHEFSNAYVILSGFVLLGVHLLSGDATRSETGLSAYSIFNPGAQRMLGSLSAEQFEDEIRHRGPDARGHVEPEQPRAAQFEAESDEEDDPDLLLALQLSLQEKKREERRARRRR